VVECVVNVVVLRTLNEHRKMRQVFSTIFFGWIGQSTNTGILRCAQDDDFFKGRLLQWDDLLKDTTSSSDDFLKRRLAEEDDFLRITTS
jgi:hypothetical protein